jgi:ATP-binding cassette, subfamily C, bacterial CydC
MFGLVRAHFKMQRGGLLSALMVAAALMAMAGGAVTVALFAGVSARVVPAFAGVAVAGLAGSSLLVLAIIRALLRYAERLVGHDATFRMSASLRLELFNRLAGNMQSTTGEAALAERLIVDLGALDGLILRVAIPGLAALAGLMALTLVWWAAGPYAVLAGIGLIGGAAFLNARAGDTRVYSAQLAATNLAGREAAMRFLDAASELRVNGELGDALALFDANDAARLALISQGARRILPADMLNAALPFALFAAIFVAGGRDLAALMAGVAGFLSIEIALSLIISVRLLCPLVQALERVDVVAGRAEVEDARQAPAHPAGLSARGLTFCREERVVLDAIDLELRPGEMIAISGRSGAGKTTLLRLLAGELALQSGEIETFNNTALSASVTLVDQSLELLSASVADNMRLAAPDASDEALWQVLEGVGLDESVRARGGLSVWIGENGASLSGGQARRLMIARALLKPHTVLLLDEPTEGLDSAASARLIAYLRRRAVDSEGRAIVIVTHDPAVASLSDLALMLDESRLKPIGRS